MRWLVGVIIALVTIVIVATILTVPPQTTMAQWGAAVLLGVIGGIAAIAEIIGLLDRFKSSPQKGIAPDTSELGEPSLEMYPHMNPPYNAVKILYVGSEIAKDLSVRIVYKDQDGKNQTEVVEQFFPEEDPKMMWHHYKYDFLKTNQVVYFHLPSKKAVPAGKATVLVSFVGATTGKHVEKKEGFNLSL